MKTVIRRGRWLESRFQRGAGGLKAVVQRTSLSGRGLGLMAATLCIFGFMPFSRGDESAEDETNTTTAPISYDQQVRPIFQASCQGCHQPAKASGDYVMTSVDRLLAGGESELAAVLPGQPDASYLLELVTPVDGQAEMPQGQEPLAEHQIELIRRWIAQGAKNDTPDNARQRYDADHPPVYTRPPVISAMDFSPDGRLLAIGGFHEVLLHKADGSGLVARLIGVSQRIESVAFSPDGQRLAVTGGLPGRMGEVQVWQVSSAVDDREALPPELQLSVPVTFDTVYGGSWSPDGKLIALGCADNSLRAIDAETGEQVLFQGAHSDWVRDTVFSVDGKNLVSVGRDMTTKLTEVATQRFVDNITSITPGVLKGGIASVARHPQRDEVVIGGSDGVPKVYRMIRQTARRIGDDANLVRRLPAMKGRVFCVAVSGDGRRIAAGSSLDGAGQVSVYSYQFDSTLTDPLKKIMSKTTGQRSAAEREQLEEYRTRDVKRIADTSFESAVYAVAFHPNGKLLAAAGSAGVVRLMDVQSGSLVTQFAPAPLTAEAVAPAGPVSDARQQVQVGELIQQAAPDNSELLRLEVEPESVNLANPFDYVQLLITGVYAGGQRVDLTRVVPSTLDAQVAQVSSSGVVRPVADGATTLQLVIGDASADVPVSVRGTGKRFQPDYIRDLTPVLTRLGCNAGTCHGAAKGKNGFKLSLRGYDPIADVRALTDDLASRRVNIASPDDSLVLLKATGAVPHVGGQLFRMGEDRYQIFRDWIGGGARLDQSAPRVGSIDVSPQNPIVQQTGSQQQVRVVAHYTDGTVRDVTAEAVITSGNSEVAESDSSGLMTAMRRGEAPVLARFEGAYAATTLTVMGDRDGFQWQAPPLHNHVDQLTAAKWKRMKIRPSPMCTDAEFVRRVYLDLIGLPPTVQDVRAFLADPRETKTKRDQLVDRLVGSDDYVEHWTNKWADLLQVNRKFLGPEGAAALRAWVRTEVVENTPYDAFARKVLTATGSNKDNPAASYFKILRTPVDTMENTTHLFLAIRFNCNKCHDHPFERWTQDQYYETAAYFAQYDLKADPASGDRKIGGSAVEGAKPLYEIVADKSAGDVVHDRTGQVAPPRFPFDCQFESPAGAPRRQQLAAWITSPDNPYFARSYVNRLWGYLFGVGIIEPIDDIRAGNPASNPELLEYLTEEFITSGFDARHILRLICKSRTYQLSVATNRWNQDDQVNYSHAIARRLPAEVMYDAVHRVTGSPSAFPGVPAGTRAAALPDAGVKLPSGFLTTLGRPPRESACECERSNELQLGPVMALVSGPVVADAIADPNNELSALVASQSDDRELISEIFLRILNRPADDVEIEAVLDSMATIQTDHDKLTAALESREAFWAKQKPLLEEQRQRSIATANADLAAYESQIAEKVAQLETQRVARIKQAEDTLKQSEAGLAGRAGEWAEQQADKDVQWLPLAATELTATNGATLKRWADRSIVALGKSDKGTYTVAVHTRLRGITGVRLEALPQDTIKGGGPGFSENGNFVVTEFQVKAAPVSEPEKQIDVALQNSRANFTQQGFDVNQSIDGNLRDQRGWAVAPAAGTVHWATFETKQPVGFEGGTVLQFVLEQYHNAKAHRLARFRISVTLADQPIGLSLPESLHAIVATDADDRDQAQQNLLLDYFRKVDSEFQAKQAAVAAANKPLPVDPGLKKRREQLAYASQPVPEDAPLVQLRNDTQLSAQQVVNIRHTLAQDLAWALINSPAFLFNY